MKRAMYRRVSTPEIPEGEYVIDMELGLRTTHALEHEETFPMFTITDRAFKALFRCFECGCAQALFGRRS